MQGTDLRQLKSALHAGRGMLHSTVRLWAWEEKASELDHCQHDVVVVQQH